ncbi:MAG: glycosyltransferase family 1 protein [Microcystis sp.]|uniref:glycosyltransferase family 1 protein n=1 Tax=Microcystis sp. TaxID=1127 RepID=UPI00391D6781
MKTIALVDSIRGGHHPTYFKIFAKTLLELGHEVIALSPEPEEVSQWVASHCPELASNFHSFELHEPSPSQFSCRRLQARAMAVACWQRVAQSIQEISSKLGKAPDITFFAWLDTYLGLIPAITDPIFPYPWSGLYFQPGYLRIPPKLRWMRHGILNPLSVLKSPHCPVVAVLDEGIADKLQQKLNKPVVVLTDITDESPPDMDFEIVKKIRAKAAGRKIVGLLGSLDRRKGTLTLLEVSQQVSDRWFFVFAGRLAEPAFTAAELAKIEEIVKANPDNCFFYWNSIPDGSGFNAVVQVCDVLYAAYENFPYSSNILTKAAIFEKPVIASKNYCMGERVEKFNLGYGIEGGSVSQCVSILERLHEELSTGSLSIQPDFEGYRRLHSIEQLISAFQKILEFV